MIQAQVPMAEMLTYEQHLTSATGGRGSYHMEYLALRRGAARRCRAKIIAASEGRTAGAEQERT